LQGLPRLKHYKLQLYKETLFRYKYTLDKADQESKEYKFIVVNLIKTEITMQQCMEILQQYYVGHCTLPEVGLYCI
jgi:hypothetical protein